jgi:hypothetical protein
LIKKGFEYLYSVLFIGLDIEPEIKEILQQFNNVIILDITLKESIKYNRIELKPVSLGIKISQNIQKWFYDSIEKHNPHCDCREQIKTTLLSSSICEIKKIVNPILAANYKTKITGIKPVVNKLSVLQPNLTENDKDITGKIIQLNAEKNEMFLFHGTSKTVAETIASSGFNIKFSKHSNLYGKGIYFASNACKSYNYSKREENKKYYFIISRVVLGNPLMADETADYRGYTSLNPPYNSIFVQSYRNDISQRVTRSHKEYIVYDPDQIYPEYIVVIKTPFVIPGGKIPSPLPQQSHQPSQKQLHLPQQSHQPSQKPSPLNSPQLQSDYEEIDNYIKTHNKENEDFINEMIEKIDRAIDKIELDSEP